MADEQLKALSEPGIGGRTLGQGGHVHGMHGDEGGLDQLLLHLLIEALIEEVAPGVVLLLAQLHAHGGGQSLGLGVGGNCHEVGAQVLLDGLGHGHAAPAGGQIHVIALPIDLVSAQQLHGRRGQQLLEQIHHAVEIRIGLIQLDGGEFGIVFGVHALVAEDAADLVHPLQAAHDQPLQVQLGGDAHVHVDIEGIVVGNEGAGGGAAGDGVEHGGLDFHIAVGVEITAHEADKLRADLKNAAHLGIDDEIHIALAIAGLQVGQAVEFFGQGQQALGQQRGLMHTHGNFAALGAEHVAADAHDVADVVLAEGIEALLVHLVDLDVELDAAAQVLQVAEHHLAHAALAHEAAGDAHGAALHGLEVVADGVGMAGHVKFGLHKGIVSLRLELRELLTAHLDLICQRKFALWYEFSQFRFLLPYFSTETTSKLRVPTGASTVTLSPFVLPTMARPKGESSEILPFMGSASWEPTT